MATLFRENGIEYDRVNYYNEPLTETKLRDLLKKASLKPFDVLRKKEAEFRELKITPEMADERLIKLIVKHPNLLQRPIVEVGNKAVIARPIEKALELI